MRFSKSELMSKSTNECGTNRIDEIANDQVFFEIWAVCENVSRLMC